jgi:hypothetical protein
VTEREITPARLLPANVEAKLNVDGSYAHDGSAGIGMVLRDHTGTVIISACLTASPLHQCYGCGAVSDGMKKIMELDFSEVLELIKLGTPNT